MKKSLKRLTISIFALFVTVCMVATTAYAWFTMSDSPSAGTFDMQVTTSDGLFISLTGVDGSYRTNLTASEIVDTYKVLPQLDAVTYGSKTGGTSYSFCDIDGNATTNPESGMELTTAYVEGRNYYKENLSAPVEITTKISEGNFALIKNRNIKLYISDTTLTAATESTSTAANWADIGTKKVYTCTELITGTSTEIKTAVENSANKSYRYNAKYFEFKLFFWATSPSTVYANLNSTKSNVNMLKSTKVALTNLETRANLDYTGVASWSDTLSKAAYLLGEGLTGTIEDTHIKAYAADALKIGFFKGNTLNNIWEPDAALVAEDTNSNINNTVNGGNYAFTQKSIYKQGGRKGDSNIAINYYDFKNATTLDATAWTFPTVNEVYVEGGADEVTDAASDPLMNVGTLTADGATGNYKLTVDLKIWIDGWDADCFDSIFKQFFRINLEFFGK